MRCPSVLFVCRGQECTHPKLCELDPRQIGWLTLINDVEVIVNISVDSHNDAGLAAAEPLLAWTLSWSAPVHGSTPHHRGGFSGHLAVVMEIDLEAWS